MSWAEAAALLGLEFVTLHQVSYRLLARAQELHPLVIGSGRLVMVGEALAEVADHETELEPQASDLALLEDDDRPRALPAQLDPRLQRSARFAALDPGDGIAL